MIRMKTWLCLLGLALLLAACNESAQTDSPKATEQEENNEQTETDENSDTAQSAEEVLQESLKAMADVNSFSTVMKSTQKTDGPDGLSFATDSTIEMEMMQEPLTMHQKVVMDIPELGETETEIYLVDNKMYFKDEMEDKWFTYPDEFMEEFMDLEEMKLEPEEQLKLLQSYTEHLTLKDEGTHYAITVDGDAEALQELSKELFASMGEQLGGEELDEMMNMAKFKEFSFTLFIDKESYVQTGLDMNMVFELSAEGESVQIESKTEATFDQFNEITEIVIPPSVIEGAEEFSLDFSGFEAMQEQ